MGHIPSSRQPEPASSTPVSDSDFAALVLKFAQHSPAKFRPYALAWAEIGYIVTESNRGMYTEAQITEFLEATTRYQDLLGDGE